MNLTGRQSKGNILQHPPAAEGVTEMFNPEAIMLLNVKNGRRHLVLDLPDCLCARHYPRYGVVLRSSSQALDDMLDLSPQRRNRP